MSSTPSPRFVHLRLHSEYSISDGIVGIDDVLDKETKRLVRQGAIGRAVADGMPALALTDLGNLFGAIKFYTAAREAGIKPIIGADVWIGDDAPDAPPQPFRLLLLARNHAGFLRLCELLTAAYTRPRRQGRAEVPAVLFDAGDNGGLIALSGGPLGDVGQWLFAGKNDEARARAGRWAERFPDAYYLEVQRPSATRQIASDEALIAQTVALAAQLDLPLVATHPIQFIAPEDYLAHEARVCIAEGWILADGRRPRPFVEGQHFLGQQQMAELFADLPEALENAVHIACRCNLTLPLGKTFLPDFPTPGGLSLDDHLAFEARGGLERRLQQLFADEAERESQRPRYGERLEFEIATIQKMGFAGYFLIVADFINWAKNHGVPVGPGRGSGAGSLVAYSLRITDLDPIRYDLLFERFLNPERVSMPDFDIDFCQDGRDRVIKYVKDKYGAHAVSQIATFGTMAAKAVIRDVGRVLDLGFNFVDQFAKLIPNELGITLSKARTLEPAIDERLAQEEGLRTLWELAEKLEGLTRNVGMHAGGVLIAPGKLTDFCPLYSADDGITTVSQFDKDDVEKVGLVKFDFLGLRTLTILDEAVKLVREAEEIDIDLDRLPLDDAATYDGIFKRARTTAVFQFESNGMKDMLVQAKPDRLEDLIALNALYRPGPMDFIPSFINRKHGREKVIYPHALLEPVLANTYGIMVYQEQVMRAAQVVANYSLGGADLLRRAMGKKKPEEMAKQRAIFVAGAAANGIDEAKANEIFDTMEKFAGYGFNKSHAAAYSFIAFQTAYLKQHHPAAFMAATMSSEMANTDKLQFFYQDAREIGLAFLPPDINRSDIRFRPVDAQTIRYGLGAIKGTGEAALSTIVKARAAGPFVDLFDFCRRVDKRQANRRVIEALIRAGAFDALDDHRARLLASLGQAIEAAEQAERHASQGGLFDLPGEVPTAHYVEVPRWGEHERLLQEKQALGFYLSGHPFNAFRDEVRCIARQPLAELEPQKEPVLLAGIVMSVRTQMGRQGKMGIVLLDDTSAQLEVVIYKDLWESERAKVRPDALLIVEGKVDRDGYTGGLRIAARALKTLAEARHEAARALRLRLMQPSEADCARLAALLAPARGGHCPVRLTVVNGQAQGDLLLSESWHVRPDDELLASLRAWLGEDGVQIEY